MVLPKSFLALVNEIEKLPGIGSKTAFRLALHLLLSSDSNISNLAKAITDAKNNIRICHICGNLAESDDLCEICKDPRRNQSVICVVETIQDLVAIERTDHYKGLYHVLGGLISPVENIDENDINLDLLIKRTKEKNIKEIIYAVPRSLEADATFIMMKQRLRDSNIDVKLTRFATGLPVGGHIDYVDSITLIQSFDNRVSVE
ncbi:MAG: recombination mediator RecR [Candidatus Dojkabacteria bacterium]|nr:recombination mediator RecR [Candidatus Dojkabacteria bacterium]